MEQLGSKESPFFKLSSDNLEVVRLQALEDADSRTLQELAIEARSRDGFDDTDPTWIHLATQCEEDIKGVMTYYG